jgi:hypothetical protein
MDLGHGHIALELMRQAKKIRFVIHMLSVYADDSSDEKAERIFAVAGIIATQEEWDAIKLKWISCTGGKIFHATDCESGYGDYKGISREQRLMEYKELTKIIAQSNMMGIGYAIDVAAYRKYIPDALEDAPYFHCFVRVILDFVKLTRWIIPQQTVKFIFDINPKTRFNSAFLYNNLLAIRQGYEQYTVYMEDEIGFATNRTVGIQVADLFTRETMKHFDNIFGPTKRPIRKSMDKLIKTGRFKCEYYHSDYFQNFRKKFAEIEKESGISRDKYKEWLFNNNCLDNAENRTRYLIELESIENTIP